MTRTPPWRPSRPAHRREVPRRPETAVQKPTEASDAVFDRDGAQGGGGAVASVDQLNRGFHGRVGPPPGP
jgi:hypothetical protein